MNESCQSYQRLMSNKRMSHITHINESCRTYQRVISNVWMSHITPMSESSCWLVILPCMPSHISIRHVAHMNESRHKVQAISHIWAHHATRMSEPCHTFECVMSHVWMRHVTNMNELSHSYECVMSHIWMCHVTCHTCQWLITAPECRTYRLEQEMNEWCHTYE